MAGKGQSRQERAGHGKARHDRERLGRTRHRTAGQEKSGHGKAGQSKGRAGYGAGLDRKGQNKSEAGCKAEQYEQKAEGRADCGAQEQSSVQGRAEPKAKPYDLFYIPSSFPLFYSA